MRKWVWRLSCVFLTLLVLALLGGFAYEQVGRTRDASQLPTRIGQVVPKHGCFRLNPTEPLHLFDASCSAAGATLYRAAKRRNVEVHVYSNALCEASQPGGEAAVRWCDTCFPLLNGGARISFEYIEQVTGWCMTG